MRFLGIAHPPAALWRGRVHANEEKQVPRRYLQGTLDFACAIYAVINALAHIRGLDLAGARRVFQETEISLAGAPDLWKSFLRNETDHYWLVRYMLERWCGSAPWKLNIRQPFSNCLLPGGGETDLAGVKLFLPEAENAQGPDAAGKAGKEAASVWQALEEWFDDPSGNRPRRAALLRFHRFLFHECPPVVSHWTTARGMTDGILRLHDASSEANALFSLEKDVLLPEDGGRGLIRIVPESVVLLEAGQENGK